MPKKNRNARRRANNGQVHTTRAPTMNGMQSVSSWNLNDVIPINPGQQSSVYNPEVPALVQFAAGPNQWSLGVSQSGTQVLLDEQQYG